MGAKVTKVEAGEKVLRERVLTSSLGSVRPGSLAASALCIWGGRQKGHPLGMAT